MQSFFSNESSGCDRTFKIAREANAYARSVIVKGYTGLNNNVESNYSNYFNHLRKGIKGSAFNEMQGVGIDDIIEQENERRVQKGESPILAMYESIISVTAKFSLGNCEILALHALNYILHKYPDLEVELYTIGGGDHRFLVINRNRYSIANDPTTWGEDAVICDPWANATYLAKDCFNKLQNYYLDEKNNKNMLEPYSPEKHFLMPVEYFNTMTLREEINKNSEKSITINRNKK